MSRLRLVLLLCLGLVGCTQLFFQPMRGHLLVPTRVDLAFEDVWFESADGIRIHGWFLPAKGHALGTVLFLHGNAENVSTHLGSVYWLPAQGFNVFLLDYRGYGVSQGVPTLPGVLADIDAAFSMLYERRDVDPERIVIFGQSLGGALAIYFAAHTSHRDHIRALAVESAFSGFREITREKLASFWLTWPFQWLVRFTVDDDYSPLPVVDRISPIPLLVIHGDRDPIVPLHHGRQLYDTAREPKELWIVPDGNHIDAMRRPEYRRRLADYFKAQVAG